METLIALLTGGALIMLLVWIIGIFIALVWIILPFYLMALCSRVERMERYLAALYAEMPRQPLDP
jgi:ABC-type spermidine/putrescine transport system permease subunit I